MITKITPIFRTTPKLRQQDMQGRERVNKSAVALHSRLFPT